MQEPQAIPMSLMSQSPSGKASKRGCNCKNSKCLKLYCECFSLGEYCSNCNCVNCHNNASSEVFPIQTYRKEAIQGILDRNPSAFRPKISPFSPIPLSKEANRHNKGCACRRTGCLKKYCECYQAGVSCGEFCKCLEWYKICSKNEPKGDGRYFDLPVKRLCFRPEVCIGNIEVVKLFVDEVVRILPIQVKNEAGDECNLICDGEALASEVNNSSVQNMGKKIYTYSNDYKRIEQGLYENLIAALQKTL